MPKMNSKVHKKSVSYAKWGYIFIAPFFIVYAIFSLVPLFSTLYNSFFENYRVGLKQIGPNFVGLSNYIKIFQTGDLFDCLQNTCVMWIIGFIPQIVVAMLLAIWFTSTRLNIKGQKFFKTVMYMPNLIMASALSMLFFALFSPNGPVNQVLLQTGAIEETYLFFSYKIPVRLIIAFMNFLMWFGNTTIMLMASIMAIDQTLYEAAEIDGATPGQAFRKVTLPLLKPMLAYIIITSLIGGLQMFDVPQIITHGNGAPNRTTMTLIMYLNNHLFSRNYGMGGAVSMIIFVITGILSIFVYKFLMSGYKDSDRRSKKGVK